MRINLTQNKFALVDEEFSHLADLKWHLDSDGYAIHFPTKQRLHKVVFKTVNKERDGLEIDHINGNRLDNRLINLRLITHRENVQKASSHKDSTSRYKGVSKRRKGWRTQLCHNGKKMLIGQFPSEHLAACAYDLWAKPMGRTTNFLSVS